MRVRLHHPDPLEELIRQERLRFAAPPVMTADQAAGGQQVTIPYLMGANKSETNALIAVNALQLDANAHQYEVDITPGGFLRGVEVQLTSDGSGNIGTGALAIDTPWSVISSISLEDISGEGVLKPMSAFSYAMKQKWCEPWSGDPAKRAVFSNSINPAFTLRMMVEVRDTLAVLANTDARAQYRLKLTIAPNLALATGAVTTYPKVTVKVVPLKWAQPDAVDLLGNTIEPTPEGLIASRFFQHQIYSGLAAGDNTPRLELVGNEIRAILLIIRNSLGARVDLTDANAGTIIFSMDDRTFWKRSASQWVEEMSDMYPLLGNGVWTKDTGVYVIPRFRRPGELRGEYWLQTVEQNDLRIELNGNDLGANVPGSIEFCYDNIAVDAGVVLPPELEGI